MTATLRAVALCCLIALASACSSPPKKESTPAEPPPPPKPAEVPPAERARVHTELATGYYERGKLDVALEELDEAVKLDPNRAQAYNLYGLIYAMLGENAKAEQNFRRALALAPQDSDVRHNWGWYLCTTGHPREAIPEFEAALRNPLYRTPEIALINAGRCSMEFGDVVNAEIYFKRALAVSPNNPTAAYGLALLAYRGTKYDEARGWLRSAVQAPVPTASALYLGMCIERKSGDRQVELSYVSQLRNRYPDSAETKAIPTGNCD